MVTIINLVKTVIELEFDVENLQTSGWKVYKPRDAETRVGLAVERTSGQRESCIERGCK